MKLILALLLGASNLYAVETLNTNTAETSGSTVSVTASVLSGNGTSGNPLDINRSSVTALGLKIDLNSTNEIAGTLINANVDTASITKQGNTFNGASQLLKSSASGSVDFPSVASCENLIPSAIGQLCRQTAAPLLWIGTSSAVSGFDPIPSSATISVVEIANQDTLQSGATAYPEFVQTNSLTVYKGLILPPGATNYASVAGSTIPLASLIGEATTYFRVDDSSIPLAQATTFYWPTGTTLNTPNTPAGNGGINLTTAPFFLGPACASGFTRVGDNECMDTDGSYQTILASNPAEAASDVFVTTNVSILNSTNAKIAKVSINMIYTQDAVLGTRELAAFSRTTGGGASRNSTTKNCSVSIDVANEAKTAQCYHEILLDANKDMDLLCRPDAVEASMFCTWTLVGYVE